MSSKIAQPVREVRSGCESLFELEPRPIEEVRNYLDEVSRQWDGALARLKSVGRCAGPAKVLCGKTSSRHLTAKRASQDPPHLAATSKNGHSVTQILHPTTFLEACVLLLYNCLNLSSQNRCTRCTKDPVPMHEWLGSQIPDTAPYIEWLAIVCSVMGVLFCTVLFSHGVLT